MYKLKITYKEAKPTSILEAKTICEAYKLRDQHVNLHVDPVQCVEIYEVDDKGYRVVGQDVIYHCVYGTLPAEPEITNGEELSVAFDRIRTEFSDRVKQFGSEFGKLAAVGYNLVEEGAVDKDFCLLILEQCSKKMNEFELVFNDAADKALKEHLNG